MIKALQNSILYPRNLLLLCWWIA